MQYFRCSHCGNLVVLLKNSGAALTCCGEAMEELIPNTTEASFDKHVAVVTLEGKLVDIVVGSYEHPMFEDHYIEWISIETSLAVYRYHLSPNMKPRVQFFLQNGEELRAVNAYCNLHGLWAC